MLLSCYHSDRGTFQENLVELTLQIQSTDLHRPMSSGIGGAQFRRIYINAGAAGMMPWMLHKLSKSQLIISRFVVAAQKTVFFFMTSVFQVLSTYEHDLNALNATYPSSPTCFSLVRSGQPHCITPSSSPPDRQHPLLHRQRGLQS